MQVIPDLDKCYVILNPIMSSSNSGSSKSKGGSSSASSFSGRRESNMSNNETPGKKGYLAEKECSNPETPKSTRGLDHGLEIPPFLVATSIVRAAKAHAVGKIAPSLMAPVTTSKAGGKSSLTPELKRRIRSEYFRILHQKRIRLKEDGKLAWMRNFNRTEGN